MGSSKTARSPKITYTKRVGKHGEWILNIRITSNETKKDIQEQLIKEHLNAINIITAVYGNVRLFLHGED